ncbi:MAG TPA: sugar ABC transporter substrate-binding protein [Solirubrobacteraceae bacterium]|nr:sugar ABC transporter substrate-binding protein [Solirubrobacteraceae bacterium]
MSDTDQVQEAVERLEHADRKQAGIAGLSPGFDRRAFLRRTAMTGVAAGSVSTLLAACGSSASSSSGSNSIFGSHPAYKFVVVNHVTTNSFFVPTQYGIQDASKLLGTSYEWTGSESENINQMVNAINSAISSGANGIAVSLISKTAFNVPIENALKAGIPVVAYNADAPSPPNKRLAYIGQDLKLAGELMGKRIVADVGSGDVVIFTANAGSANLQPRLEGAEKAIKESGAPIKLTTIVTGSLESGEKTAIEAYWTGHPQTKGMYAVDGGDTAELAGVMQKLGLAAKGVKAGGFDLTEKTQKLLHEGYIEFTIDQQPYLQGFLPILQLFLWQVSGSLTGPAEVDTGLKFIDKESVAPYVNSKSRFEGTSSEPKVVPIPAGTVA